MRKLDRDPEALVRDVEAHITTEEVADELSALLVPLFFLLFRLAARPRTALTAALVLAAYWFAYFLIVLPLLGIIEKPLPQPATIEEVRRILHEHLK